MASDGSDGQSPRDELERVLSSASFARSVRVSKLLRYLVERQIEVKEGELKESIIGVEVFGRAADYDPKLDSTERSGAAARAPEQVLRDRRQPESVGDRAAQGRIRWRRSNAPARSLSGGMRSSTNR